MTSIIQRNLQIHLIGNKIETLAQGLLFYVMYMPYFIEKLPFQHMPSLFANILNAMYRCSLSVLLKMFRYPGSSGIFAPDLFRLKLIVNLYFD